MVENWEGSSDIAYDLSSFYALYPALLDPVMVIIAISTSDTEMYIQEREQICLIHKKTRRRLNSLNFTSAML